MLVCAVVSVTAPNNNKNSVVEEKKKINIYIAFLVLKLYLNNVEVMLVFVAKNIYRLIGAVLLLFAVLVWIILTYLIQNLSLF